MSLDSLLTEYITPWIGWDLIKWALLPWYSYSIAGSSNGRLWFIVYTDFCNVNTSKVIDFRLSTWCHWTPS